MIFLFKKEGSISSLNMPQLSVPISVDKPRDQLPPTYLQHTYPHHQGAWAVSVALLFLLRQEEGKVEDISICRIRWQT